MEFQTMGPRIFSFDELRDATNKFSNQNILGRGAFGVVYKGTLPNGKEIAVKKVQMLQDEAEQFENEVNLLIRLQHRNLVQLVGYCYEEQGSMLCYEYLPNGSLEKLIFAKEPEKRKELDWQRRYNCIEGICQGLHYLHEESRAKIIHRDLKPSNILLDSSMNPKISDFDIARLFQNDQTCTYTGNVAGTIGYFAPEYLTEGNVSTKTDIYSFGVLLLEIVTGRQNHSFGITPSAASFITYVHKHWMGGNLHQLKDPLIGDEFLDEVSKCVEVGLYCVQLDPNDRPSASEIIGMLRDNVEIRGPAHVWSVDEQNEEASQTTFSSMEFQSDITEINVYPNSQSSGLAHM